MLALIADPMVLEATEMVNNKEKIKLSWFMFNLENNNKNTEHSLPMTRSSTNLPKLASTPILIDVGNKLIIAVLNTQFKDRKYKITGLPFSALQVYIFLYKLISLYSKSL